MFKRHTGLLEALHFVKQFVAQSRSGQEKKNQALGPGSYSSGMSLFSSDGLV